MLQRKPGLRRTVVPAATGPGPKPAPAALAELRTAEVAGEPGALLTAEQAAARLGCKVSALERWRCTGDGPPYVRITRKTLRYRASDLHAFVANRVVASTAAT
jgi:hypothetical protein